ncbi:MAG: UTRA domain-containing protein, partial [Thalassospira sp.]|nr:UTRA domain-containing protein [Thalassospira sp.]
DIIADASTAEFLECKQGQAWLHVEGQRFMEGDTRAIALLEVYIARAYRGIAEDLASNELPIYTLIEQRYGVHTVEVRQQISAIAIEGESAEKLGVAPGTAGLRVVRHYVSGNGDVFEVAVSLHLGDRFSYSSTLRREHHSTGG